jgi:hypothetical protein
VAAYGAPVTFAVTTQPTNGTVEIDAQGFYTYTPNPEKAAAGGTDSFVVTATDKRIHLENLLGLPGHATTMTVPVTLGPGAVVPVAVIRQSQVRDPGPESGGPIGTYHVYNTSWATQTFGSVVEQSGRILAFPAVGTELLAGQTTDYSLQVVSGTASAIQQQIASSAPVTVDGTLTWDPNVPFSIREYARTWSVNCKPTAGSCSAPSSQKPGGNIYLADAPGTVLVVSSANAQQQSDILQYVVADDLSNATFHPTGSTIGYTDPRRVPGYSLNDNFFTDGNVNWDFTVNQTKTQTNSYQYQVSVNEAEEAKLEALTATAAQIATQTWGTTIEDSLTYSQKLTWMPESDGNWQNIYLYSATPVYRFYGDWSVVSGNTTYILTDVWYDSPNPVTDQYPGYLKAYTCDEGSSACRPLVAGDVPDRDSWPGPPNYPVVEPSSAIVKLKIPLPNE